MADLYEVEVEPEVRTWLEDLTDRDFGRVDFLVGLLAVNAETLGEPYTGLELGDHGQHVEQQPPDRIVRVIHRRAKT